MWSLNKKSRSERFVSWAVINDTLKILISSDRVRLIEKGSGNKVLKEIMLDNVGKCECVYKNSESSIEHILVIEVHDTLPRDGAMVRRDSVTATRDSVTATRDVVKAPRDSVRMMPYSSPRLTCNSAKTALKISQDIQYAIGLRRKAAFFVSCDSR